MMRTEPVNPDWQHGFHGNQVESNDDICADDDSENDDDDNDIDGGDDDTDDDIDDNDDDAWNL